MVVESLRYGRRARTAPLWLRGGPGPLRLPASKPDAVTERRASSRSSYEFESLMMRERSSRAVSTPAETGTAKDAAADMGSFDLLRLSYCAGSWRRLWAMQQPLFETQWRNEART